MIEFNSGEAVELTELIPVFSLDGKEYSMPSVIPGWMALQVIHRMRTESEPAVIGWALEELLGDGYHALLGYKALSAAQLKGVLAIVQEHLMGAMEEIQGK